MRASGAAVHGHGCSPVRQQTRFYHRKLQFAIRCRASRIGRQTARSAVPQPTSGEPVLGYRAYQSFDDVSQASTVDVDDEVGISVSFGQEIQRLKMLSDILQACSSTAHKVEMLKSEPRVTDFLDQRVHPKVLKALDGCSVERHAVLLTLVALGQEQTLAVPEGYEGDVAKAVAMLADRMVKVDAFYDSLGGLVGYQRKCLELIQEAAAGADADADGSGAGASSCGQEDSRKASNAEASSSNGSHGVQPAPPQQAEIAFHLPRGPDLAGQDAERLSRIATLQGLAALPRTAEIYPIGGAGDRLGLVDEATGEPLPAAVLPYTGRTLLQMLLLDLQAREYLYWKLNGTQLHTPVAVMTSDAKGNHRRVCGLLEAIQWGGRPRSAFMIFSQPLVPVISADDGHWPTPKAFAPIMKPGGHGVIWKLMLDNGVFDWLARQDRSCALVRQISNPMAGTDVTLLALGGTGHSQGHQMGFASCPRIVGAAEGMNVLMERKVPIPNGAFRYEYGVTNVEYTEFQQLGICDVPVQPGSQYSKFPANTNVLFLGLEVAEQAVQKGVVQGGGAALPGMIFNLKKQMKYTDACTGAERILRAGRLECTMQNLADSLVSCFDQPLDPQQHAELPTFVVYNQRRRVTSSAKRKCQPGSTKIHQTPEGSFYDLQLNAHDLLTQCGVEAAEVGDVAAYLDRGPGMIFLFHPSLGPVWQVVQQKLRGGRLQQSSEVQLELAELLWRNVDVQGSLLVKVDRVMGVVAGAEEPGQQEGEVQFSEQCGRVRLEDVSVRNKGVDWACGCNVYWKHQVQRHESCQIILHGQSEFDARGVTLTGSHTFVVPDGHRMVLQPDPSHPDSFSSTLHALSPDRVPSWHWRYAMDGDGHIQLTLDQQPAVSPPATSASLLG